VGRSSRDVDVLCRKRLVKVLAEEAGGALDGAETSATVAKRFKPASILLPALDLKPT
jgi:hypothetical protein